MALLRVAAGRVSPMGTPSKDNFGTRGEDRTFHGTPSFEPFFSHLIEGQLIDQFRGCFFFTEDEEK